MTCPSTRLGSGGGGVWIWTGHYALPFSPTKSPCEGIRIWEKPRKDAGLASASPCSTDLHHHSLPELPALFLHLSKASVRWHQDGISKQRVRTMEGSTPLFCFCQWDTVPHCQPSAIWTISCLLVVNSGKAGPIPVIPSWLETGVWSLCKPYLGIKFSFWMKSVIYTWYSRGISVRDLEFSWIQIHTVGHSSFIIYGTHNSCLVGTKFKNHCLRESPHLWTKERSQWSRGVLGKMLKFTCIFNLF